MTASSPIPRIRELRAELELTQATLAETVGIACELATCGDGIVYQGVEECDDGNGDPLDGCSACKIVPVIVGADVDASINDDAYDGTIASMTCGEVSVATTAGVAALTCELGITHTWAGDLVAKVLSPSGTVVTLFSRPGTRSPRTTAPGSAPRVPTSSPPRP